MSQSPVIGVGNLVSRGIQHMRRNDNRNNLRVQGDQRDHHHPNICKD